MTEAPASLLQLHAIWAGYGESSVLRGLSLEVGRGEVVSLLGANGAGKTTTMRAITGLIPPQAGQILFKGQDLLALASYQRPEFGLTLAPEGRQVFPNLSVEENLALGAFNARARPHRKATLEEIYQLFPRLAERRKQAAGLMSGGEQQMLAIGRALMAKPDLLLLDEPSLGLAPKIILSVLETISHIASRGTSILLVEQNIHAALSVSTRGYVLSDGAIVGSGAPADLQESPLLREAFLQTRSADPLGSE
jgi:branched-chain amino acid transport system ATP-binding protein